MKKQRNRRLERHVVKWSNCTRCPLHKKALNHVLYRGDIPCEILYLGEAPGPSEDTTGVPFIGPSGQLLNFILERVTERVTPRSYAISNVLACFPQNSKGAIREPSLRETACCLPRVIELIELAKPKMIICLGKVAEKSLQFILDDIKEINSNVLIRVTYHPSYVIRSGGSDSAQYDVMFSHLINAYRLLEREES